MIEKRPCVLHSGEPTQRNALRGRHQQRRSPRLGHRQGAIPGFTQRYNVHKLVFMEFHESMSEAIAREKRIKNWRRAWKLSLIEKDNPQWRDLYDDLQ